MFKLISNTIKDSKKEFAQYGEIVIDLAVDNETWESVPLVSEAVKILNIRDVYHKNKIKRNYASFITAISEMNQGEIDNFLNKLIPNKEISEDVAETVFDIIIDAQKPIKAEVLGNLSISLARDKISLDEYNTLALMIYACSVAALLALKDFLVNNDNKLYKSQPNANSNEALLFSLGVATRTGTMFRIDERGKNLAKYGFRLSINT